VRRVKEWKHVALLAMLVCLAVSQSLASDRGTLVPMLHDVFVTIALITVLFVVFDSRVDRLVALAAAIVSLGCSWARHFLHGYDGIVLGVVHDTALALFFGYAAVEILRNVFRARSIRADDVVGSVCGYLLAGAAFASVYSLLAYFVTDSFSIVRSLDAQLGGWHSRHALFDYFSLVTLTTMGYGDVTPSRAPATAVAWLEAVFGQFYIAVVVAQLVAVRLTQSPPPRNPDAG